MFAKFILTFFMSLIIISSNVFASEFVVPKYSKDPMQNSAMGSLGIFDSQFIDITSECNSIERAVRNFIGIKGTCAQDSDCIRAVSNCPFDCYVYINRKWKDSVSRKIEAFREICSNCKHDCSAPLEPICNNNRCVGGR